MKVKDLKRFLKEIPDDAEVFVRTRLQRLPEERNVTELLTSINAEIWVIEVKEWEGLPK